ncbi:MAG: hypothetical protein WCD53_01955 [Microcoleus sp.]
MVAIAQKTLSFEEFLNWDDKSGRSFELVNGVAMPLSEPTAKHEDVVDGLYRLLVDHCQSLNLPYLPRQSKQVRLNSHLAPFSRTGKMPVPQEINFLVEHASCLFIKGLLRMLQYLRLNAPPGESESSRKADIVVFVK